MRLGYHLGYWSAGPPAGAADTVRELEDLGYDSVWTAEAYGSDAFTPLAWWGAATSRITLGTNLVQLSARTPAATAMAAMTLDHLSDGRMALGLGVSGPQVVEGWYGTPYPRPLARTREYVEIIRRIVAREEPVEFDGQFHQLPVAGGTGLGKPLRSTLHPRRPDIPILLGAEGPKNVALAAEIADGWLPLFFSPKADSFYRDALAEGFGRPGARRSAADFQVAASVPMIVDDDLEKAADRVRPLLALYIGGMGAQGTNFHLDVFARMGWEGACADVQEHFLAGRKREAIAAVPLELVTDVALIGPPGRLREEVARWSETAVTSLLVQSVPFGGDDLAGLRAIAGALR
ncbi:LLM class F420-dependent oxidoreductase [Pseudonocardia sp. RS11V-5]|uniref:LLM class F420-dependent oxidoreductase n=1 Tax=Pseudonocardia terrae TaxID=2905831 RepID=UPI001E3DB8D2|nr:LLM class F420-dependent oxidoreductase [Pseudonocardia terrae]MCE3552870.1 LLM class F420-dependent oxidoreductase [Pseudonocardia terrae]